MFNQLSLLNEEDNNASVHPAKPLTETVKFTSDPIDKTLIQALANISVQKTTESFCLTLPEIPHSLYQEQFKKILLALRGRWNGSTHLFDYNPESRIQEIINIGKIPALNPYALFETPSDVIEQMIEEVNLPIEGTWDESRGLKILEPSAGTGRIARAIQKRVPGAQLDLVEIDEFNCAILEEQKFKLIGKDWLKTRATTEYDFIFTNPPFQGETFVDHLLKSFYCLKIGGKIAAIAPASLLNSKTEKATKLRNLIAQCGYWTDIGRPFETTPVACLMLYAQRIPLKQMEEYWNSCNGFASAHEFRVQVALNHDFSWWQSLSPYSSGQREAGEEEIGEHLDTLIHYLITKENFCLYYDKRVRQQTVNSVLKHLRDYTEARIKTTTALFQ